MGTKFGLILIFAFSLVVAACGGGDSDTTTTTAAVAADTTTTLAATPTTIAESAPPVVELPAGVDVSVVGAVSAGVQPCDVQLDTDGFPWVSMFGNSQIVKLDPANGATLASYPVSKLPCEMAFLDGSLWVSHSSRRFQTLAVDGALGADPNTIDRIDPATGEILAGIDFKTAPSDVEAAAGSIWVAMRSGGTVVRIDPATNAVVAEIAAGAGTLTGLTSTPGTIWVASANDLAVVGIDTGSNEVSAVIELPSTPQYLTASTGALWVSTSERRVFKIDLETNEVSAPIDINDLPRRLSFAFGYIFVAGENDGILTRIDPATSETTEIQVVPGTFIAEPVGDRLWVPDFGGTEIYFVDPALVE